MAEMALELVLLDGSAEETERFLVLLGNAQYPLKWAVRSVARAASSRGHGCPRSNSGAYLHSNLLPNGVSE